MALGSPGWPDPVCCQSDSRFGSKGSSDMGQHRIANLTVFWVGIVALVPLAAQDLKPLPDRNRPVEISGLSVLPPAGDDWFLFPLSPEELSKGASVNGLIRFVQRLPRETKPEDARQIVASVRVQDTGQTRAWTPGELLEAFTTPDPKTLIGQMVSSRQRLMKFDAKLDDQFGSTCVRYSRLTEIYKQFPGLPNLVAMSSTEGIWCYHPQWAQYFIDVTFQQNYQMGQMPLARDADSFLKGVVFTRERPQAVNGR